MYVGCIKIQSICDDIQPVHPNSMLASIATI